MWLVLLSGCVVGAGEGGEGPAAMEPGDDPGPIKGTTYAISFEHTLSAVVTQRLSASGAPTASGEADKALGVLDVIGEIAAENIETGAVTTFALLGTIDLAAMTMEVNRTGGVALPAGGYLLDAVFRTADDAYQFVAESSLVVEDGSDNLVTWLVQPVLGEHVVTVESVTLLAEATFAYPAHELSAISTPRLGVIVDGGDETVLDINPETGVATVAFSVEQGTHTLRLKLYDGSRQIGKSHPEQESVAVDLGTDFAIDLVPLAGVVGSTFNLATGSLALTVDIPADVIDEVGAVESLQVDYGIASPRNELVEGTMEVAESPDEGGRYPATATVSGLVSDDEVDIAISFIDRGDEDGADDDAVLGSCVLEDVDLNAAGASHTCALTLTRPSLVTGNLLVLTRVHAFDGDDAPVAGATIKVDSEARGLTDADGVFDFYTEASELVVIVAEHPETSEWGRIDADLSAALSVQNIDIMLVHPDPSFREPQSLSLGIHHSCRVTDEGQVKCWGRNTEGELGIGHISNRTTPQVVSGISHAVQVVTGYYHSCALLEDGLVRCWGYGAEGQLGYGGTASRSTPTNVDGLSEVTQLASGILHTCALRQDGSVSCWGNNVYGELGIGSTSNSSTPLTVTDLSEIAYIYANGYSTCAERSDGAVYCWGNNDHGQLGLGNTVNQTRPALVERLAEVEQFGLGYQHTCALMFDRSVTCWGRNGYGELGDGTTTSSLDPVVVIGLDEVQQLRSSIYHTCALRYSGEIMC